jgi:hypothetical protein
VHLQRIAIPAGPSWRSLGDYPSVKLNVNAGGNLLHLHDARSELRGNVLDDRVGGLHSHVILDQDRPQLFQEGFVDQATLALEQVANVGVGGKKKGHH